MSAAGLARALSGERTALVVAFTTLFGMSAAHALLETGRDALFMARRYFGMGATWHCRWVR